MSAIQNTIASAESQAQSGSIGTQQPTISGERGGESNILPQQTVQEAAKEQFAFCHDNIVEVSLDAASITQSQQTPLPAAIGKNNDF